MVKLSAGTEARFDSGDVASYERRYPEQTLLCRIVEEYYPGFVELLASRDRTLPGYLQREFDAYLNCGRLEYGFLRVRCQHCHAQRLVAFSCRRRGFCTSCGGRQMVERAARGR